MAFVLAPTPLLLIHSHATLSIQGDATLLVSPSSVNFVSSTDMRDALSGVVRNFSVILTWIYPVPLLPS